MSTPESTVATSSPASENPCIPSDTFRQMLGKRVKLLTNFAGVSSEYVGNLDGFEEPNHKGKGGCVRLLGVSVEYVMDGKPQKTTLGRVHLPVRAVESIQEVRR